MSINIPDDIFEKYNEVCDYLLSNNAFSRLCTIYFPPDRIVCDNHPFNTGGSIYQHGGPANDIADHCIYCGGQGYRDREVTDTIRLRIYWNSKNWIKSGGANIADASVQVIGSISDLPKLLSCESIELVSEQQEIRGSYKLLGKPFYHGFGKNNYFVAFLKAV